MPSSRIPSPARSQGTVGTPRRYKPRRTQSVGSPARSTTSGRLSAIIQFKENNKNSFVLSPMPTRRSVLNDDTDVEEPRRRSWWKKLSDNSRDVMEVLNDNKILETNEAVEEFIDIEVLSQEKKTYSLDYPESSDSESINSIVIPQRKLFTQKDIKPQDKFGELMGTRETLTQSHKSVACEKTIHVAPKNLFNQPSKPKSKPMFPAALLNLSPNKTANKTKEMTTVQVQGQTRNLFGNRQNPKRKNMFAEFIMSESEEEISEIQPKIFGFEKKDQGESSTSQRRDPSPTSSITADIEMDDWKLLPSSTMVENQLEDMMTAAKTPKKTHLSVLSEALESETGAAKNTSKISSDHNTDSNVKSFESIRNQPKFPTKEGDDNTRKSRGNKSRNDEMSASPDGTNDIANTAKRPRISISPDAKITEYQDSQKTNPNKSIHSNKSVTKNKAKISSDGKKSESPRETSMLTRSRTNNLIINQNISQPIEAEQVNNEIISNEDDELNMSLVYDEQDEVESIKSNQGVIENSDQNNHHDTFVKNLDRNEQNVEKSQEIVSNVSKNRIPELDHEHKEDTESQINLISNKSKITNENQENIENKSISHYKESEKSRKSFDDRNQSVLNKGKEDNVDKAQNKSLEDNQNEIQVKSQYEIHDKSIKIVQNEEKEDMQDDNIKDIQEESEEIVQNKSFEENEEIDNVDNQHDESSQEEINDDNKEEIQNEMIEDQNDDENDEEQMENVDEIEEKQMENDEIENEYQAQESLNKSQEDYDENAIHEESQALEEDNHEQDDEEEEVEEGSLEVSQEVEEDSEEIEQENESDHDEQEQNSKEIDHEIEEDDDELEESQGIEQESEVIEDENDESEQENSEIEDVNQEDENKQTDNEEYEEMEEENNEEMQEEGQDVDRNESSEEIEDTNEDNEKETPNDSHDTTGRHRKKDGNIIESPEAVLRDKTKPIESFTAKGRNTSLRRTSIMKNMNIRPSLAPPRDSTGFSDGKNSSAEGSGWDSHRTTRKTLRQTFGKDFSPRKSLRALVMEKSAKRQTAATDLTAITTKFPQANSTELPEASNFNDDNDNYDEEIAEPIHEVSKRTRQTTLETYLQKIKEQNMERRKKIEENVKNSLKAPIRDISNTFKVPSKPMFAIRKSNSKQAQKKPKPVKSRVIPLDDLPPDVIDDMKYKPPKRYQPSNAAWITKRLYKFLENKLEPKYDYKARVRAEKLVESIYQFAKELRRHPAASADVVDHLKYEMAKLDVVKTHFDFYQFFHEYMPREIRVKVVPDVVNKLPMPRHGVFSEILRANTVQG